MVTILSLRWTWSECMAGRFSVPDATMITAAIIIAVLALGTMAYYAACMYRIKIVILLWRITCKLSELFSNMDFLSLEDPDDDPVMPSEYATWASAEKWRQSCIRPKDRKM